MTAPRHFEQVIRASSLPNGMDCELRWAVENVPELKTAAMLEKPPTQKPPKIIALPFGSSAHFGGALMLEEKRDTGRFRFKAAVESAQEMLLEEIDRHSIKWDDFARNSRDACEQLERVLAELAQSYVSVVNPILIEQELKLDWSAEWECACGTWVLDEEPACRCGRERISLSRTRKVILSGHLDCMDDLLWIDDFKFGAKGGAYMAQGGAYLWLVQSNYPELSLQGFRQLHIKRTKTREVPLKTIKYSFDGCVNAAKYSIDRLARQRWEYEETKNPWVFIPNANSKYCTQKTCSAWGTSVCDQWIGEIEEDNIAWAS